MARGCDSTCDTTKLCLGLLSGTCSSSWMSCHDKVDVPGLARHAFMGVQGHTCCRPEHWPPTFGKAAVPQRCSSEGRRLQTHRHWLLWGQGGDEPSRCTAITTSKPLLPSCGAKGRIDPRSQPTSASSGSSSSAPRSVCLSY